jgi:four helix bundle protein
MAKHYRDLIAWQKAMEMVTNVYRLTQGFPKEESYGLTNQLRRCAVSIPSNIAERQGRGEGKDFCHFLRIAHGSKQEMETQLLIAHNLGYINADDTRQIIDASMELGRILTGLLKSLTTNN